MCRSHDHTFVQPFVNFHRPAPRHRLRAVGPVARRCPVDHPPAPTLLSDRPGATLPIVSRWSTPGIDGEGDHGPRVAPGLFRGTGQPGVYVRTLEKGGAVSGAEAISWTFFGLWTVTGRWELAGMVVIAVAVGFAMLVAAFLAA